MTMTDIRKPFASPFTRRSFLERALVGGAAVLGKELWTAPSTAAAPPERAPLATPIKHVIISCQENRSFDHYYGYAPQVQDAGFGPPPTYSQPAGNGGGVVLPYEFTSLSTPDIGHSWSAVHAEWNDGAMDGFYTADGISAMGYYTGSELPFYYSLLDEFTLCTNYFCSLLGPTWPNRFYLAAGTSGGITTNGVWGYGIFDYPIILDLLDAAGVSWKVYNNTWDSVPFGNTDNVFVFWKRYAHDTRTLGTRGDYLSDLKHGRLPQVSWIIPSFARGLDEHPPADVSVGMGIQEDLISALRESSVWESSAYLLTYDEHGGYFDHVRPPKLDAFGLGIRVPMWVISPHAKRAHLEPTVYEHTSTLKFLERLFGLPTLASINRRFDAGTPVGSNYDAAPSGALSGPPAPPRDARREIGDLFACFAF
jgi:phospholipase C